MREEKRVRKLLDIGIREIIALSRMCNETREGLRVLVERVNALEAMEGALVERVARLERSEPNIP